MSAVSTVLTLLAVAAMFAAIVGLFKPALVMRWGKPTRLKAFLVYFLLMAVLSLGIDAPPKPPHSPAPSASVASESALATSADAVDALPAPVPYMLVATENTSSGSRKRWRYRIVPVESNQSELSRQNMAATVIAAAKHYIATGGRPLFMSFWNRRPTDGHMPPPRLPRQSIRPTARGRAAIMAKSGA